jgi:hypothetical protein
MLIQSRRSVMARFEGNGLHKRSSTGAQKSLRFEAFYCDFVCDGITLKLVSVRVYQ